MGDRGNIIIRDRWIKDPGEREAVVLYGHWSGTDMPEILRQALAKRWRWDDEGYLARIIFDVMLSGSHGDETGFGISTRLPDNEYDLLVVEDGRVHRLTESQYTAGGFARLADCPSVSFEDYIAVDERTWDNLTDVKAAA